MKSSERVLSGLGDRFHRIVLSSDVQRLIIGSSGDLNRVDIWDVNSGSLIQKFDAHLMGWPAIAFSSDGSLMPYALMDSIEIRCVPGNKARTITSALYPKVSTSRSQSINDGSPWVYIEIRKHRSGMYRRGSVSSCHRQGQSSNHFIREEDLSIKRPLLVLASRKTP